MSLLSILKPAGANGLGYDTTAEQATEGIDLSGRTVLLTGCNSGLGQETLRVLTMRGAKVIALARTEAKAKSVCAAATGQTTPSACDLADLDSVRACIACVKQMEPLDAIVCNAGVMALPRLQQKHGYELQFFTNHIGHFALVTGLLDRLAERGRVVIVSSRAHEGAPREGIQFDNLSGERGYKPWAAYGQSKLANLLFARELSRRLGRTSQTVNALHPGVIKTNLGRHMNPLAGVALSIARPLLLKNVAQGAATQCYLTSHPEVAEVSGKYFVDCNEAISSRNGADMQMAARLWEISERITAEVRQAA